MSGNDHGSLDDGEGGQDLRGAADGHETPATHARGRGNVDGGGTTSDNDATTTNAHDAPADEEQDATLLFSCQCDSARSIATLLSCLRRVVTGGSSSGWNPSSGPGSHTQATQRGGTQAASHAVAGGSANKIQHATVYAGPNGLTFHVQHGLARQSQCSVDMPRGLFREYVVGEEEVWLEDSDTENDDEGEPNASSQGGGRKEIIQGGEFGVNLTTVLECFSILSKNRDTMTKTPVSGSGGGGTKAQLGEYASLSHVPLCMSYDRGTATFHLEFLEGGSLSHAGDGAAAANSSGGCLVTCEVPGVAVADDVDDGPDDATHGDSVTHNHSGLAAAFRSSPLLSRAILHSDALQSAVSELYDVPGASIVQIALSKKGMELGTVGPRSEVWVDVPYHRGQGGMYVGLECYKPNVPLFGSLASSSDSGSIVRKYPLGAFLSGMRGLDIGLETCVSVNARGMMAIQHQISRECRDYSEDSNGGKVRPSFVDFIMTCIEDEGEEEDGGTQGATQDDASLQMPQHGGLHDITNDRHAETREAAARSKGKAKAPTREAESSSEEEVERPRPKAGNRGRRRNDEDNADVGDGGDVDFGDEQEYQDAGASPKRTAEDTTNLLGELDVDQDMLTSHRNEEAAAGKRRQNALEDIRRRRREQRMQRHDPNEHSDDNEDDGIDDDRQEGEGSNGRKRRAEAGSGSGRPKHAKGRHTHPAQDSQSQSQSEEDGSSDESEHENSLDVTADVSQLFSKRSSLSTSRHGTVDDGDDGSEEEAGQEPRMMYGDTKLEFTQDSYGSDGSF